MSLVLPMVKVGNSYSRRLHPISCQVSKTLQPLSTARMTLPPMDEISVLDWVRIETPDGDVGYYRVEGVSTDAETGEQEVNLNHGACVLDDKLIVENAGRKSLSYNATVSSILSTFLANTAWSVGTVQANETIYIEPGDQSVMTAVLSLMESLPDYQIEFEQRTETNWVVNVVERPTNPICECRLNRNLKSCDVSYSMDDICTKVYAEGISGGSMTSSNASMYGVHEQVMSLNENLSEEQKTRIVRTYLNNHDHPKVSISISGVELSQITGLGYDQFVLGTVCRVAIPWLGIEQEEVIIDKSYPDLYNYPEDVTFTLANATPDLSLSVAALTGGGGGGGGGYGSRGLGGAEGERKRFQTRFEQTDEYFKLIATETEWDEMENGTITAWGQITLTTNRFEAVVTNVGKDGTITAASIALAINDTGSNAYINADHIYLNSTQEITLSGMVQVNGTTFQIEDGVNGEGTLTCNTIECFQLEAGDAEGNGGVTTGYLGINSGGSCTLRGVDIDETSFTFDDETVSWQSQTVVTSVSITMPSITVSYSNIGLVNTSTYEVIGYVNGGLVTGSSGGSSTVNTATINYLGKANT